jgi:acetylglutamate kinase
MRDDASGFVGDVTSIDPSIVERLLREELIPVIATVGVDDAGQAYNINADTVAGAIARGARRREARLPHRRRRRVRRLARRASLISQIDVAGSSAARRRQGLGGHDPEARVVRRRAARRRARAHILDGRSRTRCCSSSSPGGHRHDGRDRMSDDASTRSARSTPST